jgi:putative transposase
MIQTAEQLAPTVGVTTACQDLGVPCSSLYRARQPKEETKPRPKPSRALSEEERAEVRAVFNSERFQDCPPRQVYATLLDEQTYLCHWRTMYRILKEHHEVSERRNQLKHPRYAKPELVATGPNQLWSWDITKLRGPAKWHSYYLYVILDVFSRYAVGWLLAEQESAQLAKTLIAESCAKQHIARDELTLHADRGGLMKAKTVGQLLIDLGITQSHSRPHVPDDNPYSEAHFKTLKYQPDFPGRFGSFQEALAWARRFFPWYNHQFYHTSLGLLTPASVHYGQAGIILDQRQQVLQAAYQAHPERFVQGGPQQPTLPVEVWINQPQLKTIHLSNQEQQAFILETVSPASPASVLGQPDAQTGSRGPAGQAQRSLDTGEHPAKLGPTLGTGGPNLTFRH